MTPNDVDGSQNCQQRFDHQNDEVIEINGAYWCSTCYNALNPTQPAP